MVIVKLKEIDQATNSVKSEESTSPNKLIAVGFVVVATIAVGSLIALAVAVRKTKKLTKKSIKAPCTEMEAQKPRTRGVRLISRETISASNLGRPIYQFNYLKLFLLFCPDIPY